MSGMEAVIFDLGNVLLAFDAQQTMERLRRRTGKTLRELQDYLLETPFVNQLEVGQLTGQQFFEIVAKDLDFDGEYCEFAEIWTHIFSPMDLMIALARSLQGRVRRFVLSNTNAIHMEQVRLTFPFLQEMDGLVLSHEVGWMKPDRRIYEVALNRFGLVAERTVFIDDTLANVEGARAVGLRGIHHRCVEQTRAELTKLGITPI